MIETGELAYMLHTGHESERGDDVSPAVAHEHLKDSEVCFFCESYEQSRCPTITMLEASCRNAVALVREELSFEKDVQAQAFLSETITFLEGRVEQIRYFVTAYVESIVLLHSIKRLGHTRDEWKLQGQLENADRARRRSHDALIASLAELTARIQELVRRGYVDEEHVVYWDGWKQVLMQDRDNAIVIFSPSIVTHARRREIQEWAVATDFGMLFEKYSKTA